LAEARQRNNKLSIHGKDCEVKAAEPKSSSGDSNFQGHHFKDKRKGHDRHFFPKEDALRTSGTIPLQSFNSYAPPPYYSNLSAYQQQFYSTLPSAAMYGPPQGNSYHSSPTAYEPDAVYPAQTSPYAAYSFPSAYLQPYPNAYVNGAYPMGYSVEEPPYQEKAYGTAPSSSPYTMPAYGYQPPFSPVNAGIPTPPPPQQTQVVPGYVTVSPYQTPYDVVQFTGSDQSLTDNQGEDNTQNHV